MARNDVSVWPVAVGCVAGLKFNTYVRDRSASPVLSIVGER